MLTNKDKAQLLRDAIELLEQADALQRRALGDTDVGDSNHELIMDVVEEFVADIVDFEDGEAV